MLDAARETANKKLEAMSIEIANLGGIVKSSVQPDALLSDLIGPEYCSPVYPTPTVKEYVDLKAKALGSLIARNKSDILSRVRSDGRLFHTEIAVVKSHFMADAAQEMQRVDDQFALINSVLSDIKLQVANLQDKGNQSSTTTTSPLQSPPKAAPNFSDNVEHSTPISTAAPPPPVHFNAESISHSFSGAPIIYQVPNNICLLYTSPSSRDRTRSR